MNDKTSALWDRFFKTGRVADYLAYTQSIRPVQPKEQSDAGQDERHGIETAEYR